MHCDPPNQNCSAPRGPRGETRLHLQPLKLQALGTNWQQIIDAIEERGISIITEDTFEITLHF